MTWAKYECLRCKTVFGAVHPEVFCEPCIKVLNKVNEEKDRKRGVLAQSEDPK